MDLGRIAPDRQRQIIDPHEREPDRMRPSYRQSDPGPEAGMTIINSILAPVACRRFKDLDGLASLHLATLLPGQIIYRAATSAHRWRSPWWFSHRERLRLGALVYDRLALRQQFAIAHKYTPALNFLVTALVRRPIRIFVGSGALQYDVAGHSTVRLAPGAGVEQMYIPGMTAGSTPQGVTESHGAVQVLSLAWLPFDAIDLGIQDGRYGNVHLSGAVSHAGRH